MTPYPLVIFHEGYLADAVLAFVSTYGFIAVFIYIFLETSLLLHFVPSEVILPVAIALLVTGPVTFVIFVGVTTSGAVIGCLVAYYLFGRNAERALRGYGGYVHLGEHDLNRWEQWFTHWGETIVLWGRLLPVVRAFVSVPAGMASMNLRRFVLYSSLGSLIFNTGITYLVYMGTQAGTPLRCAIDATIALFSLNFGYLWARPATLTLQISSLCILSVIIWWKRHWIQAHPFSAIEVTLRAIRIVGTAVGLLLITAAAATPTNAYALIAWIWNDPRFFVQLGASPQTALVLSGLALVGSSLLVYTVGLIVLSSIYNYYE